MTKFAEVAVDAPAGHDRTFSYSVPSSLDLQLGQFVVVPFGNRKLQGVVFSLPPSPQVDKTRDVLRAHDEVPVLTGGQLELARWVSTHYMCTLFEACSLMLPPGGRLRWKTYVEPAQDGVGGTQDLSPFQERLLAYVRRNRKVAEQRATDSFGPSAAAGLRALAARGLVVCTPSLTGKPAKPKTQEIVAVSPAARSSVSEQIEGLEQRAPKQAEALRHLANGAGPVVISQARKDYGTSAVNGLIAKGMLEKRTVSLDRDPLANRDFPPEPAVSLTPSQMRAAFAVRSALEGRPRSPRGFLLQGVTGSGKTEVYLDAVRRCLNLGKRAIVLVPEIALTHQTIQRFASRFPGNVAVLHSGLTPGERFDQWWKVHNRKYKVVIGSRSAVFAPQPDLGLIVVDEEHEWSYKQHDAVPRYHARDVALRLAELSGAVALLGSASPDVESYRMAVRGDLGLLTLPERIASIAGAANGHARVRSGEDASPKSSGPTTAGRLYGRGDRTPISSPLASVAVVDMRKELREGNRGMFSRALHRALRQCLDNGSQALLFLNRRGSASYLQCRDCGRSLRCRRCDIAMTYHRDGRRMLCHYCGYARVPPSRCTNCRSSRVSYYGLGTQTVERELAREFPGAKVLRWDRDTAGQVDAQHAILKRLESGEADVLVGTQMIAKGLHLPAVTVVGVVLADIGLNLPDYRAGERAFQLLCQVAGRAGRGASEGRVVVQTYQPDNYAIKAAATQDYRRFYREEIAYRKELGNPPFNKMLRMLYAHTNRALCEREALRLSREMRQQRDSWGYSDVEVLGPTPAYPARVRGHYRWQIILRGPEPRALLEKGDVPQGWVVDVDPVGLG